jgi:tRNA/rRNA methyltransferase
MLITVPTSEIYPIMNLSHAVAIVLYELSELEGGSNPLARALTGAFMRLIALEE